MNKFINQYFFVFLFIGVIYQCNAQKIIEENDNPYIFLTTIENRKQYDKSIAFSKRGNSYQFMDLRGYLGTNNAIIENENNEIAINHQWILIENVINSAQVSKDIKNNKSQFMDNYKTWISLSEKNMYNKEVALYEGYSFFYITQFLYYTKINGWRDASLKNKKKWDYLLSFIETNIWIKWGERSLKEKGNYYYYYLGRRTHMGSHWAGIAMYLGELTKNNSIMEQCNILVKQYDTLLKRNFKMKVRGYIWNSTYDNVEGTYGFKERVVEKQDVPHGNHVISYIIGAYKFGNKNWLLEDIKKLCNTLKEFIYIKEANKFSDYVDGTNNHKKSKNENFLGDGWVKLANYDRDVKIIFVRYDNKNRKKMFNQEIQLKANLYNK